MSLPTHEQIMEAIQPVIDPELGISVVDLGMIYNTAIDDNGNVTVTMTLTTPYCPLGPQMMNAVRAAVSTLDGVRSCEIELTFSPPWDPRKMPNDDAKMQLGIM